MGWKGRGKGRGSRRKRGEEEGVDRGVDRGGQKLVGERGGRVRKGVMRVE